MAGVVAMAAVVEDFEATQPCKKLRKDDDPPPTKTITNYFMPLPKAAEKPFSPPRTNNIMDYFSKTSPAQEKIVSLQKNSPLQSTQSFKCQEVSPKLGRIQRQKRTRKPKEQSKQQEDQEVLTANCTSFESPEKSLVKEGGNCSVLGSDTAALLSQISNDICFDEESVIGKNNTDTCATEKKVKDMLQIHKSKKVGSQNRDGDNLSNDNESLGEEKSRNIKSAVHKCRKARVSQSDSCAEQEKSLHDASMEVNVDESSLLNSSTVTVSFEDFLQSQSQVEEEDATNTQPNTHSAVIIIDDTSCDDTGDKVVPAPQVSPRTLTVQAEVHSLSPNHEKAKSPEVRVASIFSRNKKESQAKESKTSSSANSQGTVDILPDLKRKSNVVLHEEDLELAVVESSCTPKCTQEERKQFMNAFKQPCVDGSKGKTSKGQGKLKQIQEKSPEIVEKEPNDEAVESKTDEPSLDQKQSVEQNSSSSVGNKRCRKAGRKKQKDTSEEVPAPTSTQEELPTSMEVDTESGSVDKDKKQPAKELRRSTRESTRRQAASVPEKNPSPRKTRGQENAEKSLSQDDPAVVSTPKSHRPKKKVYRAEMLSPKKRGSPIRMKFTRVFPSSATKAGDFVISSPVSVLESNSLKKRKQAKKLVQKAKALQQSKQTAAGEQSTVRRSARRKECEKMNYCEDEDSVVFVEDLVSSPTPTSQKSSQRQKKLRSLNDVLGKNMPPNKVSKNVPASKLAPMFLERKAQKPVVISIFDDSSRDGSENSQDDEQFRAKREFLKSGLPESFKKQIAKTAANREAYTQACASFQPVVHVQQMAIDCFMWTLPWPRSSLLSGLKEFYQSALMPQVSVTGIAGLIALPAQRTCREKVSGWRADFTEPVRQRLLEKISESNPSFPAQRYFTRFLKRHKDYLSQTAASAESECGSKTLCPAGSTKSVGGKRKRIDEGDRSSKLAKKQKSSHTEEEPIVISESPSPESVAAPETAGSVAPGRGQRRRSLRNKQAEESKPAVVTTPEIQCDSVIILDSPSSETACTADGVREDVLWTEKYQPQHSNDVIGNTASVRKLHSWLKEWKLRADREERRKQQEKKQEDDSNDSWLGDCEELDEEDLLCNTLLITGPTGVGKTAAVYACAQELGFKVFEVNCSSQRSGRQILSQLKEATQSHQVDIQGVNAHKPTYFNSYSSSSSTIKPGSSPRKVNSPRRVVSSPRKPPQSPRGATRKGGLAPTSLANFFKVGGRPTGKVAENQDKKAQTVCSKKVAKVSESGCKTQKPVTFPPDTKPTTEEQGKRTATSLILFEEVDVIFDDDSGFLAAVKTFMTTTKRPVILTTSDPTFSAMFDGCFDEIHFKAPSVVNVASYLQLLCLAENVWTDRHDLASLLHWNRCDVRQSLLHLQFWACSGGGHQKLLSGASECKVKEDAVKVENVPVSELLPPCHTGCTESLLGLLNIQQGKTVEDLLRCEPSVMENMSCWGLLSETERKGMNLLYSNMEVLLPLPVRAFPEPTVRPWTATNPEPQPGHLVRHGSVAQQEEHSDDMSPLKVSSRMKRKKQLCLDDKSVFQSDSESEDGFLSLPQPGSDPAGNPDTKQVQNEAAHRAQSSKATSVRRVELSEAERKRSKPVSQCLTSLAEYLDHMSFLDSSLHYRPPQTEGACRSQAYDWTGAEIKSGMTDEVRLECGGYMDGGSNLEEISAVIESLSFCKCRAKVSEAWHNAQELEEEVRSEAVEELTLPVASHRQSFSLADSTLCEPRVIETRKKVMSTVLTNRSFSTLGNRVAATVDYMPSLRTICRSERLKEQGKVKRRFMHYFSGIYLDLPKSIIELLASDFP